jgi:bile acid-coenzyme A ligase
MTAAPVESRSETPFGVALRRLADVDPDRPALTCGGVTLTRARLVDRSERLAASFADHGVRLGSTVAIGLSNSVGFVESLIATWMLGAVPLSISHRLPSAERTAILDLADPALTVGVPLSEAGGRRTLEEVPDDVARVSSGPPPMAVSPQWKMMTSGGSTGRPKLIVAGQPAVFEKTLVAGALFRMPTDDCVLVPGPLSHNGPFVITTYGLLFGNHVVLMPRFDAAETLRLVETHAASWLYLVPTMMLRIWRLPEDLRLSADVSSLQVAFHLGAPCPPWLKEAWIDWLGPEKVMELYGGTEAQAVTVITGTEWLEHRGSVGRPGFGEIVARDAAGRTLPPLEVGEIWLRTGEGRPPSYQYIGATPKRAKDGWESLGDMGYVDADGYIYITDRDTDMILVGGANVYPAEVEAALDEHPAMRSSCVIGLPDGDLGSVPHAIMELAEPVSDDELQAHLRERLAPYKLPRTFERVTTPLRDDAGKIRRSALRAERIAASEQQQRAE